MRFLYYLEYAEADEQRVMDFMSTVYDYPSEYEYDYEMGTLIIYTNVEPMSLEEDIFASTSLYAINYGKA